MTGRETEHLFSFAGINRVDGHRNQTAASRCVARSRASRRGRRSTVSFIRIHWTDHVFARAVIDLNRASQITLCDAGLAHVHAAHRHVRLAPLAQAFDHCGALSWHSSHRRLDGDLEITSDRFFVVRPSLPERDRGNR